jgi:protein-tyrosine sulfotransferase
MSGRRAAGLPPDLLVLVAAARSGSTLLRLILDSHPEIGCPAEAGIPGLIANLGRVWWTIDADLVDDRTGDPLETHGPGEGARDGADDGGVNRQLPDLPAEAKAAIRAAATAPMHHYCAREGKRIYCDKSLDSVYCLEAVRQVFPETRHILLFRHVLDTVASGVEASPWGFNAYGYTQFIQRSPENFVAALVSYWVSHVDAALRWQEAHPGLCHCVRYEDLVTSPGPVVAKLCAFLHVDYDATVLTRALSHERSAKGPGDYKVTFTSTLDPRSIGHGKRVPVDMVPPPLLEAANEKLKALGYESLDRGWNIEPAQTNGRSLELDASGARLSKIIAEERVHAYTGDRPMDSFAVVAQDDERLRWIVDLTKGTIRQGDGEVECVITGTAEDLALLLSGEVNTGVLLRSGRVRYLSAREDAHPANAIEGVQVILETLGNGRRRGDREDASLL